MAKQDNDDDLDAAGDEFFDDPEDPKPRTSLLTTLLCFLNVAAAAGFAYLLVLNVHMRREWSYAVFMYDLRIAGLPLEEEDSDEVSASRAMFPRQRLEPAKLKDVYSKRGGKSVSEPFQELQESFQFVIKPSHLRESPEILKDYFSSVGESDKPGEDQAELNKARKIVFTLEEEVKRLIDEVPAEIAAAAKAYAAAAKDKRAAITNLIMPLTLSVTLVERLDKKMKDTPDNKLEALLTDVAQRRMYHDFLNPMEIYRPHDDKAAEYDVDRIADLDIVSLNYVIELFKRRMQSHGLEAKHDPKLHLGEMDGKLERDSIEKRQAIAYLLTALYHIRKPNDTQLLYKFGPDRAMALVGVWEYTYVYQLFADAHYPLRDRFVDATREDRDGRTYDIDGKFLAMHGFQTQYREKIGRIQYLMDEIWKEEKRLRAYEGTVKGLEQVVMDREIQVKKSTEDLLNERKETARMAVDLRRLQKQLLEAQGHLSTAIADNLRLNDDLREARGLPRLYSPKKK